MCAWPLFQFKWTWRDSLRWAGLVARAYLFPEPKWREWHYRAMKDACREHGQVTRELIDSTALLEEESKRLRTLLGGGD